MKVYLARHGETTGDVEGKYGGDYDDSLTEKGKEQAKELAKKLSGKEIEIIYHSPRKRASETAEILQQEISAPIMVIENFRERNHYGLLTGMTKTEAQEKFPEELKELEAHPVYHKVRASENYLAFKDRVLRALNTITNEDNKVVLIVTHSGPIRCVLRELFKKELASISGNAILEIERQGEEYKIISLEGAEYKQ